MAKQPNIVFLEEWLRTSSGAAAKNPSPSSAREIIQAWSDLRDSLRHQSFSSRHLHSLKVLLSSQSALHVADPQAKLLISLLSSPGLSLPRESSPLLLRLLYIWVRKSFRPSTAILDSAVEVVVSGALCDCRADPLLFAEAVLLLGAFSFAPAVSQKSKVASLECLVKVLYEQCPYPLTVSAEIIIPNVLAGVGYALSSPISVNDGKILDFLFGVWGNEGEPCASVPHGLMVLHLIEWVVSGYISVRSSERVGLFSRRTLEAPDVKFVPFAVLMGAGGVLRACGRIAPSGSGLELLSQLRVSAENRIESISMELISRTENFTIVPADGDRLLLLCLSIALARSGFISPRSPILLCLASALLVEIFPLRRLYPKVLEHSLSSSTLSVHNEVKEHLDSVLLMEAGAITGIFCDQYVAAEEENRSTVESLVWNYCRDIYLGHRPVALVLCSRNDGLLADLEKIAEPAFLMVAVFALAVTKQKLNTKYSQEAQREVSLRILVAFSCVEYFRRMRLSEYMDTIRGVVGCIQETEYACISFVESIPSYLDLTKGQDGVQTARILFYLRVIPTFIERLPSNVFRDSVAPTMFLYMGHPNAKVARASHSLFAAFLSSGKDSFEDEQASLKEQFSYYYVQRSLEGFPDITPFEGLASGVGALVRHLPAGSAAIFYCIHSLAEKTNALCRVVLSRQESDAWKSLQGENEPCKKILDLLLRLLSLVDIQVLPDLMKLVAKMIVQLPKDAQDMFLNDLYSQVADSDDVTRKPTLVSWLQSLSYLCSQNSSRTTEPMPSSSSSSLTDPLYARL
ncbi:hypothetical protein CDL15_Pgr003832 [Punica granatum]|uniref:Uncharacterized protein n=1 Tax=Punica granatum TaxID=22663 RepID=A0A218XUB8_PUNGR|nr:hypothetical protein CDL15_Pgr003832 [Punica granatum]